MFRSFLDHHQGALLFLAKVILQSSQFNSFLQTRCCGSMSDCVGMCCRESSWLGVHRMQRNEGRSIRRTPSQLHSQQRIPTQHDMLPQHNVYRNELNGECYNITLARRNIAP